MANPNTYLLKTRTTRPSMTRDPGTDALVTVVNNAYAAVEIREIWIDNPRPVVDPNAGGGGVGDQTLAYITAVSGGVPLVPVKHDSLANDLPAQVVIVAYPDSVTYGATIRSQGDTPGVDANAAFNCWSMTGGASVGGRPFNPSALGMFGDTGNGVQPIVINPGFGIAISEVQSTNAAFQYGAIQFRERVSGATYTLFTDNFSSGANNGAPDIVIFNGLGSGAILEVSAIELFDTGSCNSFQQMQAARLMFIFAHKNGETITPVALDSTATPIDAGVTFLKNSEIRPSCDPRGTDYFANVRDLAAQGNDALGFISVAEAHPNELYTFQFHGLFRALMRPRVAAGKPVNCDYRRTGRWLLYRGTNDGPGIMLRKGQGLAVVPGYWSSSSTNSGGTGATAWSGAAHPWVQNAFGNLDVNILFNYSLDPVTAGTYSTSIGPTATTCKIYGNLINLLGAPVASSTVTFSLVSSRLSRTSTNIVADADAVVVTTDANGFFAAELIRSSALSPDTVYKVVAPEADLSALFSVPDAISANLLDLTLREVP